MIQQMRLALNPLPHGDMGGVNAEFAAEYLPESRATRQEATAQKWRGQTSCPLQLARIENVACPGKVDLVQPYAPDPYRVTSVKSVHAVTPRAETAPRSLVRSIRREPRRATASA